MGLTDYTNRGNDSDDDSNNGSNNSGTGGAVFPGGGLMTPPPPMKGIAGGDPDDIASMLIDYNERFKNAAPTLFRDAMVAQTFSVLIGKAKPNPLLVGPAGVGKTRIVEEIARLIAIGDPGVPAMLAKATVYELPLSNIIAGAGIVGQLEARLAALVDFVTDKNNDAILFIDEIHLIQSENDPVYRKVAQILKPALARGDMRLIGATTMNEARSFDDDPAFQRRFSRLVVDELTREQTVQVLLSARSAHLAHYKNKITVSDEVLREVAIVADENSKASAHRPDNALTLLDRAMADAVMAQTKLTAAGITLPGPLPLGKEKLRAVAIKLATGFSVKEPFDEVRTRAELIRLRGQDEVLEEMMGALRRDDLAVFPRTRPSAWILAGPSGVGKTEAVKIVSAQLTGQPPIVLNMGEFHTQWDTAKVLGSPPGYVGSTSDKEMPFDTLESNPYRVVLLDEIEKAHPAVHRLFLTALDEGYMRMASGKVIDFSKALIVATTNAAREEMGRNPVGFTTQDGPRRLTQQELVKALQSSFDAEFLGRFSMITMFAPLNAKLYEEILVASYERERLRIVQTDPTTGAMIPTGIDPDVLSTLVKETYLVDQGARPAEKAARALIENAIIAARFIAPVTIATADDEQLENVTTA